MQDLLLKDRGWKMEDGDSSDNNYFGNKGID
jgi:hypothetical protein